MSRSHLLAGLFLVLGTADLALLNVWLVPAAWPPPSDPIATLTTSDALERTPEVEEMSAHGHTAALESPGGVLVESAGGTEPSPDAAVNSYSADAAVELKEPSETQSEPAGDLLAGPGGTIEPQPVGPDLAGFEVELEEVVESTAEHVDEPLAETGKPSTPLTTAAVEPILASRDSGKTGQPSVEPKYQILHHAVIQFSFNKDTPRSAASDILGQTLRLFREHPDAEIQVDGHTDSSGNEAYNYYLSERRAQAVATELEAEGIPSGRIQVRGYGPSRLLDTRDIGWARAKNRRVEITIRSRLP